MRALPFTVFPLLLLLSGCSATRLAYNQADWLLEREVVTVTCPSDAQKEWLADRLDELHRWHRKTELPRYAAALRAFAATLDGTPRRRALNRFNEALQGAYARFIKHLAPTAGAYLAALSPDRRRCMAGKIARRRDKTQKEVALARARYVTLEREKLEERLEDWIGDFTAEQKRAVEAGLAARQDLHRQMLTAWANWSRRLLATMAGPGSRKERQQRIAARLGRRYALFSEAERPLVQRWDRQNRAITWAVVKRLSAEQRKTLKNKLTELAKDFEALAGQ